MDKMHGGAAGCWGSGGGCMWVGGILGLGAEFYLGGVKKVGWGC